MHVYYHLKANVCTRICYDKVFNTFIAVFIYLIYPTLFHLILITRFANKNVSLSAFKYHLTLLQTVANIVGLRHIIVSNNMTPD
jgi:hypothetical protein